jgi:23S rRNA-/tRNA-specific pseudouridylate synthase
LLSPKLTPRSRVSRISFAIVRFTNRTWRWSTGGVQRSRAASNNRWPAIPRTGRAWPVVRGGRTALSIYRVNRPFHRFTLLDVQLKTGRTHQIRVHLAWLKHPSSLSLKTDGGGPRQHHSQPKTQVTHSQSRPSLPARREARLHAPRNSANAYSSTHHCRPNSPTC